MIASMNDVLAYAEKKECAVGAFNTPNLECMIAVLRAAEKLDVPVIISHAEIHEPVAPLEIVGPVMMLMAKQAKVPVCVQLDHCEKLDYMKRALEIGFTGVMFDGSTLPYAENLANTKLAVAMAKEYGANVEAELGALPSREDGVHRPTDPIYTDPDQAVSFVKETGIDALTPSFGTVHGIYRSEPRLDLELVKTIKERVGLPLVMHGGSGVSDEDFHTAIRNGIRKVNYYTYMAREGVYAVKHMLDERTVTYFHDLAAAATDAMQVNVESAMKVIYCLD